jgi:hypothetical protein
MGPLNFILLVIGAISCLGLSGGYMWFHRGWFDNDFGKMVVTACLSEGILFAWLCIVRLLPPSTTRSLVSTGLFAVTTLVMFWRFVAYLVLEIRLQKRRENAVVEEVIPDA